MKSILTVLVILTILSIEASCIGKDNANSSKFLLLNNNIIEKTENVKLEVGTVVKHQANPLFGEDRKWEIRFDNLYGNVIFDEEEKIYKCWYSPFIVDSSSHGMTLKQRNRKYKPAKNREMAICYATSKNGIKWDKPNLGLIEFNGSKQNNIVWRGPHGTGIFKDLHEKDASKRYKVIFRGLAVSFSSDGIHWDDKTKVNGVDVAGDTHNNALWAPTLNKYVGITRTWGKEFGREVARIESDDFINWTKEEVVMHGTTKDLQTYAMPTFYYGGVYLGLVAIHQQSSDRVWTELTWSPDTKNWYRIDAGNPLIACSEKELDYDYGCVYACAYPVFDKGEIKLYYGGSDWLHTSWRNAFLCLATLRPDGFAGFVQKDRYNKGIVETKVIDYDDQDILLNADVDKGGFVKVTVLNNEGNKIASSKAVSKTMIDKAIKLDKSIDKKEIKLRFEIKDAKVYSFSLK